MCFPRIKEPRLTCTKRICRPDRKCSPLTRLRVFGSPDGAKMISPERPRPVMLHAHDTAQDTHQQKELTRSFKLLPRARNMPSTAQHVSTLHTSFTRVIRCWVTGSRHSAGHTDTQTRVTQRTRTHGHNCSKYAPDWSPPNISTCSGYFGTAVWCPALGVVSTLPDVVFTLSIPSFSVSSATLASRAPS